MPRAPRGPGRPRSERSRVQLHRRCARPRVERPQALRLRTELGDVPIQLLPLSRACMFDRIETDQFARAADDRAFTPHACVIEPDDDGGPAINRSR